MADEKDNLGRFVGFRMKTDEFAAVEKRWRSSNFRKLSGYLRQVLLERPVTVLTRDRSMDELMEELVLLRRELNAIGVNFNQAVHRLHTLDHSPQMQAWLARFEQDKDRFFSLTSTICKKVDSIADQWLQ